MWWTKWRWGRFSPGTSVSPANFHSTNSSTITLIYHLGLYNRPEVAVVPDHVSPTPLKKKDNIINWVARNKLYIHSVIRKPELFHIETVNQLEAVPLVALLSPPLARVCPRVCHVGFMMDRVALWRVFSEYFGFPANSHATNSSAFVLVLPNTTYIFSMALPAHSGPWPLTQFRNDFSQTVGLLGQVISPPQGRYLNTE
jgi:hypothetical protein